MAENQTGYLRGVVLGFILELLPLSAVVVISFACGYGIRERISATPTCGCA
jgi:hypothetical protein